LSQRRWRHGDQKRTHKLNFSLLYTKRKIKEFQKKRIPFSKAAICTHRWGRK
jgi:hypothetical protein